MPTARFAEDGDLRLGVSTVEPYNRFFLTVTAVPWLEGTLRYTEVTNRLYGPEDFSGDQTYKDRGIDLKLRLWEEGPIRPQVALGFQDIGGTSLFSSEYLVASKRYFDWDFTLGVAWGYLGNRGGVDNPLGFLSDHFDQARPEADRAGDFSLSQLFTGSEVGFFAGVQYQTPVEGLALELEYDGNDYGNEPFDNDQPADLPVNLGVHYRPFRWLDLSLGLERGNTFMAQVAVGGNLNRDTGLPRFGRAPVAVEPRGRAPRPPAPGPGPASPALRERVAQDATRALAGQGFKVEAVAVDELELTAFLAQDDYRRLPQALGREARVLAQVAPPSVEALTLVNLDGGLETARVTLMREDLARAAVHRGSSEEVWASADFGLEDGELPGGAFVNPDRYPSFDWSLWPALRQHIGGPDNFYFWQIQALLRGEVEVARGASVTGVLGIDVANNFDGLRLESNSELPRVRSDIKYYLQEGETGIRRLEADYLWKPAGDWYARVSAGLLEEMFGGVGGEVLYRPWGSRLALGADLAWVKQRDFDQKLDFRDYEVVTGHATLYYELPFYDLRGAVSAGRYLAGDVGVTFDLSRRFDNGTRVGAFATFTDVSAEEFGEGSFDKGIYLAVPLDLFLARETASYAGFTWRPLTRDGGQRLAQGKPLYPLTDPASLGSLGRDWQALLR
jgi:hypothetical protein